QVNRFSRPRHIHHIRRSLTEHMIRNAILTNSREPGLGHLHHNSVTDSRAAGQSEPPHAPEVRWAGVRTFWRGVAAPGRLPNHRRVGVLSLLEDERSVKCGVESLSNSFSVSCWGCSS